MAKDIPASSKEIIVRIKQLLFEVERHEWQHENGRNRLMRSLQHNLNKLDEALEREDNV